ncbi:MAG: OmpH family outer membrane protein [bacterium]
MKNHLTRVAIIVLALISMQFCTANAQKIAFFSSSMVRQYYPDAQQAGQRVQSLVEEWKRELDVRQQEIDALEFEIKKNRLIWTTKEKLEKEQELQDMKKNREGFAQDKFAVNGQYDKVTKDLMGVVEIKIYAAVQQVAADNNFDMILDQSQVPMPYVNYKYDMTLQILRKLGVDTKALEKDLQEKIAKDPRNEQKKAQNPRRGKNSRVSGSSSKPSAPDRSFDGNPIPPPPEGGIQNSRPKEDPLLPPLPPDTTKNKGEIK